MAHVENTVMDVYYRNDSMKSGVGWWLVGLIDFLGALGSTHKVA